MGAGGARFANATLDLFRDICLTGEKCVGQDKAPSVIIVTVAASEQATLSGAFWSAYLPGGGIRRRTADGQGAGPGPVGEASPRGLSEQVEAAVARVGHLLPFFVRVPDQADAAIGRATREAALETCEPEALSQSAAKIPLPNILLRRYLRSFYSRSNKSCPPQVYDRENDTRVFCVVTSLPNLGVCQVQASPYAP